MAIVTSSDTDDSRTVGVARSAGSAVLGYVVPWSTPARAVAKRVARRRSKPARVRTAAVTVPRLPRRKRSRISPRGRLVVLGLAGIIGGGVVFSAIRRGQHTPPPVAAAPPRVEDVPTR